jgi:propane monooxygenase reductase component
MGQVAEAVGLYPVRLLPGDRVFHVEEGEDVLTAGLRQGIDLRYGCRHGKCTTCKYVVVEGDAVSRGASPYAFADRELEQGAVLLCSTFARSPLVITPFGEQPPPDGFVLIPPEERGARVVSLAPASADLVELRLRPDAALSYRPGQYAEIGLPGTSERRSYSMTHPPDPSGDLTFLLDAGHRRVLDALTATADEELTVLGPFGRFYLRPSERPILMAAAGAGLGPLLAILRELRAGGAKAPLHLYYGTRSAGMPLSEELDGLAADVPGFEYVVVDLEAQRSPLLRLGPIIRRMARDVPDASGFDAYVAGPVGLCDAVEALLTAKGLPERRIFCERFYSASS